MTQIALQKRFMSIFAHLKHDASVLDGYSIQQIVAICGDGKLRDDSKTSEELRLFLKTRSPEALSEYGIFCLEGHFERGERGGFVLQDVVNEMGRRLGYKVKNGLYQGRSNAIGFDGLWSDGENELIIEVKTSDAYRINLDTLFSYGQKLNNSADEQPKKRCALIVVGRQDTGDLEAQIRGSRYAWSVRMVSIEALTKLMFLNAEFDDQALTQKIRKVLLPFEYTRVDNIIDLVFETQKEADSVADLEVAQGDEAQLEAPPSPRGSIKTPSNSTPRELLDAKRFEAVSAFFGERSVLFSRQSKTNFASEDDKLHVSCAVSKRYRSDYQPYWYALHPAWLDFMRAGETGFFLIACMDRDEAYAVPVEVINRVIDKLNISKNENGKMHWHVALQLDQERLVWNLSKAGETIDLTPFRFDIKARYSPDR